MDGGKTQLQVTDLEGGRSKTLATGVSTAEYDSGHLLYVREGALMARPFDLARLEFTGDPFRIEAAVETNANGRRAMFGSSGNGIVAFRRPSGTVESLSWFGRDGRELGPLQQNAMLGNHHEVSPDGRRVAFGSSTSNTENGDLWVTDIERGVNSRLTSNPALDWVSAWSPDGRRLAFTSNRNSAANSYQLYVIDADTPGSEKPLVIDDKSKHHMAWSPDGKHIVYEVEGPGQYDLWSAPVEGGGKPAPLVATEFSENQPAFSPDGRWLAYISNRTGRHEVYVREFPGGPSTAVVQVSTAGGIQPRWRKDGKELLYLAADGHIMSVPVQSATAAFVPGNPVRLFRTELLGVRAATHYTMTTDAQRFLLPSLGSGIRQEPYIFLVNWVPPAKR
jgi:dipeptidyl aminopeptidase/acylaminoacyl peptidase